MKVPRIKKRSFGTRLILYSPFAPYRISRLHPMNYAHRTAVPVRLLHSVQSLRAGSAGLGPSVIATIMACGGLMPRLRRSECSGRVPPVLSAAALRFASLSPGATLTSRRWRSERRGGGWPGDPDSVLHRRRRTASADHRVGFVSHEPKKGFVIWAHAKLQRSRPLAPTPKNQNQAFWGPRFRANLASSAARSLGLDPSEGEACEGGRDDGQG